MKKAIVMALLMSMGGCKYARANQSGECWDLWTARNEIYKEGGYCFRTELAQHLIGNENCHIEEQSDVPLSNNQRNVLNKIIMRERQLDCHI